MKKYLKVVPNLQKVVYYTRKWALLLEKWYAFFWAEWQLDFATHFPPLPVQAKRKVAKRIMPKIENQKCRWISYSSPRLNLFLEAQTSLLRSHTSRWWVTPFECSKKSSDISRFPLPTWKDGWVWQPRPKPQKECDFDHIACSWKDRKDHFPKDR